jgi:hypothetical protein
MESGPSRNTEATSTLLGVVYHRLLAGESPQRAGVLLVDNHPIPSQSLATGRLPTFSLPFVDCELPQDTEQLLAADGTPQVSCKYRAYTIVAHFIPLLFQFHIGKPSSAGSVFLRWSRAFSPPAHRSTLSSLNSTAKSMKWNFLHMHSNRPLRAHLSLL